MLMVSSVFFHSNFRFIKALDSLDYRVEKLRKESISLTEKRDLLLMSMDILKHNELLSGLNECKHYSLFGIIPKKSPNRFALSFPSIFFS